jgi:SAM-dependent methyltransferase
VPSLVDCRLLKNSVNFDSSAELYDLLYKDKDYARELKFIEKIFSAFGKPSSILEVGCGTGNYTRILHQKGYEITGLDASEKMISLAKQKCDCTFHDGDIRGFSLGERFDSCIALFAVMSYVVENSDVVRALSNVRDHLKPGGLFVFDVWNGLAVMRTLPEVRVREVEDNNRKILRTAYPKLEAYDHVCVVDFKFSVLNKKDQTIEEFHESHRVRFYFPQEIKFFLEASGFEVLKICPFLDFSGVVDESVWNMTIIARATASK